MAAKYREKFDDKPKSPRRPRRTLSPNNVIVNGQTIDRIDSENLTLCRKNSITKKVTHLDNIIEECDSVISDGKPSQEHLSLPLEDTVKIADENVQKFIEEMSRNSRIQENVKELETACSNSQEELRSLNNLFSTIDDGSKNKIVDTLINVYKKEIISAINNSVEKGDLNVEKQEVNSDFGDKMSKLENVCEHLINNDQNKIFNQISPRKEAIYKTNIDLKLDNRRTTLDEDSENHKNFGIYSNNNNFKQTNRTTDSRESLLRSKSNEDMSKENKCKERINEYSNFSVDLETLKNGRNFLLMNEANFKSETSATQNLYRNSNFVVNYHTKSILKDKSLKSKAPFKLDQLPAEFEAPDTNFNQSGPNIFKKEGNFEESSPRSTKKSDIDIKICPSKEEAISRILGRKTPKTTASVKYKTAKTERDTLSDISKNQSEKNKDKFYEEIKKLIEDPEISDKKRTVKSEGVQASYGKSRKSLKPSSYIQIIKPYKYHPEYIKESKSDIAIECPFGCLLKIKKSKSATDVDEFRLDKRIYLRRGNSRIKQRGKLTKNEPPKEEKPLSVIKVDVKPSTQLLESKGLRRKKQMIKYLEADLKRGDSDYDISQILFETPNAKNIENDASSMIIPTLEEHQVSNFNVNYLLHAIEIQKKSDILIPPNFTSQYCRYNYAASNPSVTEEDYRIWLKKQNWSKYSSIARELQSMEDLRSISQTMHQNSPSPEARGEFGYFLERENVTSYPSSTDHASNLLSDLSETFLYEHVVISRAINLFYSFSAKRTRIITIKDRLLQIMLCAFFYTIWVFLDNRVFDESNKKGASLWN